MDFEIWTITDIARDAGCSEQVVRYWADKGVLPTIRTHGRGQRVFMKSDAEAFIAARKRLASRG